jgi:predicted GIY-YIG superfamily endonuclease
MENCNSYVYKHIRLDTNEVFYIGIGNQKNYKRAYSKHNRNLHWKNVVNKTEYIVEIVKDNLSWEDAVKLEIELIKKYGRSDLNEGTLVNMTDGGDGVCNLNDDVVNRIREKNIGKPGTLLGRFGENHPAYGCIRSEETREKMRANHHKCWTGKSLSHSHRTKIKNSMIGENNHMYNNGHKISGEKNGFFGKHHSVDFIKKFGKAVVQSDLNDVYIAEWLSIAAASTGTGVARNQIRKCCKGEARSGGGFLWKLK